LVCIAPPSDRWRSRLLLLLLLLLLHLLLGRENYIEARLREFREARAKEAIEKAKAERGVDWRDKEETTEKEFDLRGAFARSLCVVRHGPYAYALCSHNRGGEKALRDPGASQGVGDHAKR
jgi:hypothetical protein